MNIPFPTCLPVLSSPNIQTLSVCLFQHQLSSSNWRRVLWSNATRLPWSAASSACFVSSCLTQGNPVQEATLVLKMGGRQVTEQLMDQVCGKATSWLPLTLFSSFSTASTPFRTTTSCCGGRRRRRISQSPRVRRSSERWRCVGLVWLLADSSTTSRSSTARYQQTTRRTGATVAITRWHFWT